MRSIHMKSVIDAIVGVLLLVMAGNIALGSYQNMERESLLRVHKGLSPLAPFTRSLTGTGLSFNP
jgi:hypothetical protein